MEDLNSIVKDRLSDVFKNDTQETVARKLNTSQGNVSKWVNGQQVPTTDMLYEISKAYDVSVDWILGRSKSKEIDGLVIEKLTYEQTARVLDRLLVYRNLMIEEELGFKLIWDRLDGKKASRIKYRIQGLNFDDHSNYNELMNQTIDAAVRMRDVFKKYM